MQAPEQMAPDAAGLLSPSADGAKFVADLTQRRP